MAGAREDDSSSNMGCRVIAQGYKVVDEERHAVDYQPSVWEVGGMDERETRCSNQRSQVAGKHDDPMAEMKLIDAVQRLGISYHFQDEIHASLQKLKSMEFSNESFHEISLQFWLLRQERYYMSCDVFQSFVDNQKNLNVSLRSDVRALLALYEAAHLGTPNEQFLIQAQRQTTSLLRSMVDHLEKPLADKVRHAVRTPSFRRMKRLEARLYIPLYEEDKEDCDELILELAKLDFYLLQQIHREEVKEICEWYHGSDSPRKLFYARHRPTEAYFWALGVYYEPQYAKARKLLAKFIATITPYDDTFDNYGIWEELQPFADVMQRWDMKEAEGLNECYSVLLALCSINEVCKGYLTEIGWRDNKYIPPFVVFEENVTEEILKWMSKFPQIVKDSCIISRLMDDIVAHEFETERNNVATAVTCYMKEYKTTKEEASDVLWNSVEHASKSMNHEYLTWTSIPSSLLIRVINLARMMETMYKEIDGYTDSKLLKEWISILLDQPIPL